VREFNAIQAAAIAATLGIPIPVWNPAAVPAGAMPVQPQLMVAPVPALAACPNCQKTNPPGARFCTGCGTALA
jgi:hypothetical protein